MEHYVVGFLFSDHPLNEELSPCVLLIRKKRPEWQAGLLNGVGGHIEEGESADEAMEREFVEEAGLRIKTWRHFVTLSCEGRYECLFFSAKLEDGRPETKTDEELEWHPANALPESVIWNLRWLIPLAMDEDVKSPIEIETE